jgi:hypothetical protein
MAFRVPEVETRSASRPGDAAFNRYAGRLEAGFPGAKIGRSEGEREMKRDMGSAGHEAVAGKPKGFGAPA